MGVTLAAGDVLAGRYRLERELGSGGMAVVFSATDLTLERAVAVKLLHQNLASQPHFRTRFRQEAQAAARMNDAHIVKVFDAGEQIDDDGAVHPFLVMEQVEGRLLSERLAEGALPPEEAIRIMSGVLTALEYSHAAGIVHRDIKPNNIMLTADGGVKVMDFGIARAVIDDTDSVAQTTTILGTAAYFSPEQARGESVDARSDIYSAGVVLFELLTGEPPFQGETPVQVAYRHLSENPRPPSELNPAVSPQLDLVVLDALAKAKIQRYPDAAAFRSALEAAAKGDEPEPPQPSGTELLLEEFVPELLTPAELALRQLAESAEMVRPQRRPPVMWLWAGGTLVFALVIGVLFWALALAPSGALPSNVREVPDVSGLSELEAIKALEDLDLEATVVERNNEKVAPGEAIGTDPAEREIVTKGTKIVLFVSLGKQSVAIPNLQNQDLEAAKAALIAAGFVPGIENNTNSASIPAGLLIGTDPVAGSKVERGATVNLVVSNGKVTVPDVRGKPLAQATATLSGTEIGLIVVPKADTSCRLEKDSPVTAQSLGPGDVDQRSEITLSFCAGG